MPSALSDKTLAEAIPELYDVSRRRRDLEKQETALKDFFKEQANGEDFEFTYDDLVVKVTSKSRESLDRTVVAAMLSRPKFESCLKTSTYQEVSVAKVTSAAS